MSAQKITHCFNAIFSSRLTCACEMPISAAVSICVLTFKKTHCYNSFLAWGEFFNCFFKRNPADPVFFAVLFVTDLVEHIECVAAIIVYRLVQRDRCLYCLQCKYDIFFWHTDFGRNFINLSVLFALILSVFLWYRLLCKRYHAWNG